VLHLTNGDSTVPALRAAGVEGEILPWREVLHDGPVPGGLDAAALRAVRARFLAPRAGLPEPAVLAEMAARDARLDAANADGEPIALWFESDLFDVLLLLQILARLAGDGEARLVLVGQESWTSLQDAVAGAASVPAGEPIDAPLLALARDAWAAFTSEDPTAVEPLAAGTPALPAIGRALRRHLEELPWIGTGLSRTERQLLEAYADGARTRTDAFLAAAGAEERPFLGDTSAWAALDRLAPLLDGEALSAHGEAVLAGEAEWRPPQERWLGGVRLAPGEPPWRWDPATARVV
jgi:hypothetical protein